MLLGSGRANVRQCHAAARHDQLRRPLMRSGRQPLRPLPRPAIRSWWSRPI